ncbi:hypothetical protein I4U23_015927 [Adineta vaga]|nr:hypothetical protein I4U23_015927 [Adineta vaga]
MIIISVIFLVSTGQDNDDDDNQNLMIDKSISTVFTLNYNSTIRNNGSLIVIDLNSLARQIAQTYSISVNIIRVHSARFVQKLILSNRKRQIESDSDQIIDRNGDFFVIECEVIYPIGCGHMKMCNDRFSSVVFRNVKLSPSVQSFSISFTSGVTLNVGLTFLSINATYMTIPTTITTKESTTEMTSTAVALTTTSMRIMTTTSTTTKTSTPFLTFTTSTTTTSSSTATTTTTTTVTALCPNYCNGTCFACGYYHITGGNFQTGYAVGPAATCSNNINSCRCDCFGNPSFSGTVNDYNCYGKVSNNGDCANNGCDQCCYDFCCQTAECFVAG